MKFAQGVLKTKHIDHYARLCHASTVAGLATIFGSGAMTNSIGDIAQAKCVCIIGSSTFENHPLIGRRVMYIPQALFSYPIRSEADITIEPKLEKSAYTNEIPVFS